MRSDQFDIEKARKHGISSFVVLSSPRFVRLLPEKRHKDFFGVFHYFSVAYFIRLSVILSVEFNPKLYRKISNDLNKYLIKKDNEKIFKWFHRLFVGTRVIVRTKHSYRMLRMNSKIARERQMIASCINFFGQNNLIKTKSRDNFILTKNHIYRGLSTRDFWGTCSQINHFLFFLHHSEYSEDRIRDEIDFAKQEMCTLLKPTITENVQEYGFNNLVGGLMKLLMGFSQFGCQKWVIDDIGIDELYKHFEKGDDACNEFNFFYVLTYRTNYRNRYSGFIEKLSNNWKENYYYDSFGMFSFNPKRSLRSIHGIPVNRGFDLPDLHGSAMFWWALAILDDTEQLKVPVL